MKSYTCPALLLMFVLLTPSISFSIEGESPLGASSLEEAREQGAEAGSIIVLDFFTEN